MDRWGKQRSMKEFFLKPVVLTQIPARSWFCSKIFLFSFFLQVHTTGFYVSLVRQNCLIHGRRGGGIISDLSSFLLERFKSSINRSSQSECPEEVKALLSLCQKYTRGTRKIRREKEKGEGNLDFSQKYRLKRQNDQHTHSNSKRR